MATFKNITPAKNARRIAYGDGQIEEFVNEILACANDAIHNAIDQGQTSVQFGIRTTFDIPRMKNADAQRSIYYWVMKTLEENDYKVNITFVGSTVEEQNVFLNVRWFKKQDVLLQQFMDDYIKKHVQREKKQHHHSSGDSKNRTKKHIDKKTRI